MRYQVHNMFSFLKQKLLINKDIFEFFLREFYSLLYPMYKSENSTKSFLDLSTFIAEAMTS
jgi:hypothetical protein